MILTLKKLNGCTRLMILRCQKLPTITENFLKQKPLCFTLMALASSIHTSG